MRVRLFVTILLVFTPILAGTAAASPTSDRLNAFLVRYQTAPFTPIPGKARDGSVEEARSGCCSHHGGVAGCDSETGYQECSDGSDSPSCRCGE